MTLAIIRSEPVPVEEIKPGGRITLAHGKTVTVQEVVTYDDGATYIVRWWRHAELGEPGFCRPGVKPVEGESDGRLLGSLIPVPAGHCWTVERAPAKRPGSSRRVGAARG